MALVLPFKFHSCGKEDKWDVRSCNSQLCCEKLPWTQWTDCSTTCGLVSKLRYTVRTRRHQDITLGEMWVANVYIWWSKGIGDLSIWRHIIKNGLFSPAKMSATDVCSHVLDGQVKSPYTYTVITGLKSGNRIRTVTMLGRLVTTGSHPEHKICVRESADLLPSALWRQRKCWRNMNCTTYTSISTRRILISVVM